MRARYACMPDDAARELEKAMDEVYATCEAMDESSSDAHKAAQDIDDSGVVLEFVDPTDEISIVTSIRRLEDELTRQPEPARRWR